MLDKIKSKIYNWQDLQKQVQSWQAEGDRVVFTNGCFDILHYGHLHYLAEARSLGNRLVVGMNAASSVKRLKGNHRPINDEMTRQYLMAALVCVDAVTTFEEDTPLELIRTLLPDILVKGGDWEVHQIVGAEAVLKNGGEVKSLKFIEGYSTTAIEEKIKNQQQ